MKHILLNPRFDLLVLSEGPPREVARHNLCDPETHVRYECINGLQPGTSGWKRVLDAVRDSHACLLDRIDPDQAESLARYASLFKTFTTYIPRVPGRPGRVPCDVLFSTAEDARVLLWADGMNNLDVLRLLDRRCPLAGALVLSVGHGTALTAVGRPRIGTGIRVPVSTGAKTDLREVAELATRLLGTLDAAPTSRQLHRAFRFGLRVSGTHSGSEGVGTFRNLFQIVRRELLNESVAGTDLAA